MKAIILSIIFLIKVPGVYCQEPVLVQDTVQLQLAITDYQNKPLQTTVHILNKETLHVISLKTNSMGLATFKLPVDHLYEVSIQHSTDRYDYELPAISTSPASVTLKFNPMDESAARVTAGQHVVGIRVINNADVKQVLLNSEGLAAVAYQLHNDTSYLVLENNRKYSLSVPGTAIVNQTIQLSGEEYHSFVLCYYNKASAELFSLDKSKSLITIVYTDLSGMPASKEQVEVKGKGSAAVYRMNTAENGTATCIVPQNDVYEISLQYYPQIFTLPLKEDNETNTIVTNTVRLEFPTSLQYAESIRRDARRIAERDSLYAITGKARELSELNLQKSLAEKAAIVKSQLATDSLGFIKEENTVCAVLYRNRSRWPSRIIVTDVTGSMYPYMEQLTLWHLLEQMDQAGSDYVFFNDGDNKPDRLKNIGETGGLYFCGKADADGMVKTMYRAMRNGGGGDSPENDMEALIFAQREREKNSELILVADNLSSIKDIELLGQVKVPVHVVLCGAKNTWINPEYLQLAYETGGSVHTIEEDLFNLSALHDEDRITINKTLYVFKKGRFFPLSAAF